MPDELAKGEYQRTAVEKNRANVNRRRWEKIE
jgi:hypothetical protein